MGVAMREQGHFDPAVELISRAVDFDVEFFDGPGGAIWDLGLTLRMAGRFDEAVAAYQRIRELKKVSSSRPPPDRPS